MPLFLFSSGGSLFVFSSEIAPNNKEHECALCETHFGAGTTMLSRTPLVEVVVVSSSSSSSKRRSETLRAKATSLDENNGRQRKQRRRDVFATMGGVLFLSLLSSSPSHAYGTGGWKDCEPICDSLKGGFAAQQKLQEEMMRQSMGGGGDDTVVKEESKGKKAAVSEREKRKKNLR